MPKPYALSLYSPATQATQRFQGSLTALARGWRRSIRSNGGCWQGEFDVDWPPDKLQRAFELWMGYEVRERAAGMLSWAGLVYEMDLTANGITRRRSLDLMVNRVKTTYTKEAFGGDNFVKNPGLDYAHSPGGGANDNFNSWLENSAAAGGTILWTGAPIHGGIGALQLTGDGTDPLADPLPAAMPWLRQNINVTPGTKYQLTYWTYGGGVVGLDNSGVVGVRDPNESAWIYGPAATGYTIAAWRSRTIVFEGPSGGEVLLFLMAPHNAGAVAYFDDIELLEMGPNLFESQWATIDDDPLGGIAIDDPDQSPPIARYGVKEEVIHLDNYPQATSEAYRDTHLMENAYPWPRPVSAAKRGSTTLSVKVVGYVWTMNWMYVQNHSGTDDTISAWLPLIVGTVFGRSPEHGGDETAAVLAGDCQFVRTGNIGTNALVVPQATGVEEHPWDTIEELTQLGDGTQLWRSWVDANRLFHYQPLVTAPRYFIRKDGVYDTMSGTTPSNPWLMQPAVFRDMTYRSRATEHGLFLPDPRDMYVEEVEMADGWNEPTLKTAIFSEADLLLIEPDRGEEDTGPTYEYVIG